MDVSSPLPPSERERRALFRAIRAGDARLDGCWYVGNAAAGIYCRAACGARPVDFAQATLFRHPAQAEKHGLRPCPDCRPELAPGDARVDVESMLARLALRRIEDGALDAGRVDALAAEFEVSTSALCDALDAAFGLSPRELANTQRLIHARQLLGDTGLPVTDVARYSGFDNPRRFSALFKSAHGQSPSAWRRRHPRSRSIDAAASGCGKLDFRLDYRPPLNWTGLLAFLGARAIPGVEGAVGNSYLRTVRIGEHRGTVSVMPCVRTSGKQPVNALAVSMSAALAPVCVRVLTNLKTVFDTRANAAEIDAHLGSDPLLASAIAAHGGMRLPGAFDGFELLLRAILGQQVSVKGATTLAGRMAAAFGEPVQTDSPLLTHLTPEAGRLADASVDQIARIGMPGKRAQTIRTVARAVAGGEFILAPGSDPEVIRARLIEVPGIGDWTASYVAMRALAWPDALPHGDLGIKKALGMTRAADIVARTESWRPWRAYGAIYLWLSLSGG